jgi:threonine/homoserine/homoserine lactone efflux protein
VTIAFLAAVGALALLTVLPGPDFAITIRWAIAGGRRAGFLAILGIQVGILIWGGLAVVGLAALFAASPVAYTVVRIAGAGYLVWMAARLIGRSFRRADAESDPVAIGSGRTAFRQGMVTNLLNPKIAAFYVGVLPALVPVEAPPAPTMAALVLCHVILGVIWLGFCTLAVAGGRSVLGRPAVRRWLDRVTGAVLLGFAARLALDAG